MRILTHYVIRQFMTVFVMTLAVFLFVMAVANVFKVIDLFSRGVPGLLILKVFSYGIPFSLIFAIPMSVLASAFLVFSRMASDRELIALRACGISLWTVVQPPILVAAALSLFCVYINCNVAPKSHYARRTVLGQLGVETPLSLLDEGRFIHDFPGYKIYIGRKDGARVEDIVIYEFDEAGVKQTVRARAGTLEADPEGRNRIHIHLFQVRIDKADEEFPNDLGRLRRLAAEEYPLTLDVGDLFRRGAVWKKRADLRMAEILAILRGSARLRADDLLDPVGLARRLADPPDRLTDYLLAHLSDETAAGLDGVAASGVAPPAWRARLADDLNRLIAGPSLFTSERFAGQRMTPDTRALLERGPEGAAVERVNRMMLEDAYHGLLARSALSDVRAEDRVVHRLSLLVEVGTRLALSLSCYAFALLGAALGMRVHRKESSIGLAVSLALVFVFYFFIILAESLVHHPQFQPQLIVWIPFVASEIIGYTLIRRAN